MNKENLKKIIRESIIEFIAEKAKEEKAKQETPKSKLDQTKDDKIDAGDAVVAARKAKIAQSKGDKKDAAYYEKIRKIVNRRIGQKAD